MNLLKLSITCLALLVTSPFALASEKEGGGGSLIAAEFASIGRASIEILAWTDPTMDLKSIFASIRQTKIIPTEKICRKETNHGIDYCEDAIYDAQNNLILLDYPRWKAMSCTNKMVLSTHELLRAAGLESEDYAYSGRFASGEIARCHREDLVDPSERALCKAREYQLTGIVAQLCERFSGGK